MATQRQPDNAVAESAKGRRFSDYFQDIHPKFKREEKNPYKPLDSDAKQFRLLVVLPSSGKQRVKCHLRLASLTSQPPPQYETISYSWGSASVRKKIEIDDVRLSVPASSAMALARMRLPDRKRTLWIDAICINQLDLDERTQQVLLMKDVYRKSSGNLVYLGEKDDTTDSAAKSIANLLDEIRAETNGLERFGQMVYNMKRRTERRSDVGIKAQIDFDALERFYSRSWFRRLWVTQEIALAPSNMCFCGTFSFRLLDLVRITMWLRYKFEYLPYGLHSCTDAKHYHWWELIDKEQGPQKPSSVRSILDLLLMSRARETSDERDRIFGMLGLFGGEVPETLQPNYHKPVLDVLCDATRQTFVENGFLTCFALGQVDHLNQSELESPAWPSWLPKWEREEDPFFCFPQLTLYPNLEDAKANLSNPANLHELQLSGVVVDKVARVSHALPWKNSVETDALHDWLKVVEDIIYDGSGEVFGDERSVAINTTLIAGTAWEASRATEVDIREANGLSTMLQSHRLKELSKFTFGDIDDAAAHRYYNAMVAACRNRLVVRTASGLVGLAPSVALKGDIIAMLYGGHWPVVLRPSDGGKYRLVGHCYVYGVTPRDALESHRAAGLPDKTFTIW